MSYKGPRLNRIIDLLEKQVRPYGVFVNDLSDHNARWLTKSWPDFVVLCMEHHPFDPLGIRRFIQSTIDRASIAKTGSLQFKPTPLVRIPITGREIRSNNWIVKQVLDSGVCGIVFPMVETGAHAEAAVAACRYSLSESAPRELRTTGSGVVPEDGFQYVDNYSVHYGRSAGPKFTRFLWGVPDYIESADVWPLNPKGELLVCAQIESMEGVSNLNEILQTRGLGAIMIGPGDLRLKMGKSAEDDPDFMAVIAKIVASARSKGVYTMILVSPENYDWYMSMGVDICIAGFDAGVHVDAQAVYDRRVLSLDDTE